MIATLPAGYVAHMPATSYAPRHLLDWPAVVVPPCASISGYEQHERKCLTCGAVRVTVIPTKGDPWREWRERGAVVQSRWPAVCEGMK